MSKRPLLDLTKTILDLAVSYGLACSFQYFPYLKPCICCPGGELRYISDGDVQSPFLGLKFAI